MEGVLQDLADRVKGWKSLIERVRLAKGKEVVVFEVKGAVAARVFLSAFNEFHKHYTGTNLVIVETGLAASAQVRHRQHFQKFASD